ncbi:DUF3761 domain-containing protein [Silvimonas sp.]|uniref:DUF3761 domain-containing protein n=1 Tax=Silvimonas sp. TaxID=2650811 RepID=UPI00386F185D
MICEASRSVTDSLAGNPAGVRQVPPKYPAASQTVQAPSTDNDLVEQGTYVNKAGNTVHKPAHTKSGRAPDGATAKCGDGTYSFSQNHRGTCSHHGGVADRL